MANVSKWKRVWDIEKFDDLFNRDERFFSVLIKGMIGWLNSNISLYGKPIQHFIYTTGSSYMYVESNGYVYSMNETSGEDYMYMQMPRCIIELGSITVPIDELTNPFTSGTYERRDGENIRGFYAQMRRMPIELDINLKYVLSNFNESIVLVEELISKILFQRYFSISFLGQIIKCSIEFPQNFSIDLNHVDMTDANTNQKNVQLSLKICSNYPAIDENTEIPTDKVIASFNFGDITGSTVTLIDENNEKHEIHLKYVNGKIELVDKFGNIISDELKLYDEFGNLVSKDKIINMLISKTNLTGESTLFFGDLSNTVDIISRDKILK